MLVFDQLKRGDTPIRVVAAGIGLGMLILIGGLWYVQVVSAQRYRAEVVDQSFRIVRVPAIRGKILDRNGFPLAENRPAYNLNLYLEELRKNFRFEYTNRFVREFRSTHGGQRPSGTADEYLQSASRFSVVSNLLTQVTSAIRAPAVLDEKQFTNHYNNLRSLPFPLVRDLSSEQIALFVERGAQQSSLSLEVQPIRVYRYGSTAAHLLGYLKRDNSPADEEDVAFQFRLPDYIGQIGVELAFDTQLRGRPGVKSVLVNNLQYRQAEEIWNPPQPGQNVVLTLDLPIQLATEQALKTVGLDTRCAAVVMDCRNGDLLAAASYPTFDPNQFLEGLTTEVMAKLTDPATRPLINRATHGAYPPGSIFKIIVSLACLEAGTLNPSEIFESKGSYQIDGRGHVWHDTAGAGKFDLEKAFYLSSNPYFIDHGLRVGFERVVEMGRKFGLGRRTGINTHQEVGGYFPDPAEKLKKDGSRWMAGDTANLCIGQGDITVTPLQMAVMTAAVANGGIVYEPRLVDRIVPQDPESIEGPTKYPGGQIRNRLKLNPKNLEIVRNAMLQDVEHKDERGRYDGTGRKAAIEEMQVCGKTGTAQVMEGRKVTGYITWFVSFAPFDSPRYAVVVMVETEKGSGGGTCAPVAHDIYEAIAKRERGLPTKLVRPGSSLAKY